MDTLGALFSRLREDAEAADPLGTAATLLSREVGFDTLSEATSLSDAMTRLASGPLLPGARVRLLLLLYEHLVHFDDVYDILGNLLNITLGIPYRKKPLVPPDEPSYLHLIEVDEKMRRLITLANEAGYGDLAGHVTYAWMPDLHAAFAANISWIEDTGRVTWQSADQQRRVLSSDGAIQRAEAWIDLVTVLSRIIRQARRQYTNGQLLEGRLGHHQSASAVVDDSYGLVGLQPTGSV